VPGDEQATAAAPQVAAHEDLGIGGVDGGAQEGVGGAPQRAPGVRAQ
jgi:hypothetical protein